MASWAGKAMRGSALGAMGLQRRWRLNGVYSSMIRMIEKVRCTNLKIASYAASSEEIRFSTRFKEAGAWRLGSHCQPPPRPAASSVT